MKKIKYYIASFLAAWGFMAMNAQEVVKKDSIVGFNAMDYLMQGKYKFPDQTFMKKHWMDNLYLQVGGGLFMPNRTGENKMEWMQDMHLGIGKNVSAKHGFRLGYHMGIGRLKATDMQMKRSWLHLDHLFNVSAYINGYNPNRFFEVSTIWGAGYMETAIGEEKHRSPEGHLGLELKFKVGPQSFLTFEPMVQITDGHLQDDWRHWGLGSGATLNYIQYLRPLTFENTNSSRFTKMSPFFIELATGLQFQNLGFGRLSTKGGSYAVYVGKWLSDGLGVRGGVNGSFNRIKSGVVDGFDQYNDAGYVDGRFDLLVNPLGLFGSNGLKAWGGFHLFGGILYGHGQPFDGRRDYAYSGYNTGIQGWVRLQDNLQLFVEPRVSFVGSEQANRQTGIQEEVHETLYNLNLGLRMNYSTWDERKSRYLRNSLFTPSFFVQAAGGLSYSALHQCTYGGNEGLDYAARISAGYRFSPYHALRANFDYFHMQDEDKYQWKRGEELKMLSLDYMFGLSNLMQEGYDKERSLGVDVYAGPLWEMGSNLLGGHAGFFVKKKLNAHTSLFVSPEVTVLPKDVNSQLLHHNLNPIFNVYAGVEYAFNDAKDFINGIFPQERNKKAGSNFPFFVETGVGGSAWLNGPDSWSNTIGTSFKYSMGHWINPAVAVRLSAESMWNPITSSAHQHTLLGGADVMFNPLGISSNYRYDSKLGFNLVAGGNLGLQKIGGQQHRSVYGAGAGMQLWTRLMPHTRLFFEPRYQYLLAEHTGNKGKSWLSAQMGVTMDYIVPKKRISISSDNKDFEGKGLFFQLEGGLLTNRMTLGAENTSSKLNMDWGMAAGYQFSPLLAVRLGVQSQAYHEGSDKEERLAASLAYMLNLNTLLSGYHPESRFSADLYAGPSAYYHLTREDWAWGGLVGLQFGYKMNSHLGFHFAPELHAAFGSDYSDRRVAYKLGLTYRLNNYRKNLTPLDWFVNTSTGVQILPNAPIGSENTLGTLHKLSVGTWLNSLVGVRLGGTASLNRWAVKKVTTSKYLQHYSLQTAIMFNPISLFPSYDRATAAAGLYLFGGPEMGMSIMEKNNKWNNQYTTGFHVGMQGWVKVDDHQRVFIEPSYAQTTIQDGVTPTGTRKNEMMGLNVGLSMDIVKHPRTMVKKQDMKHFFVQLGAGNGSDIFNQNHDMKSTLRPLYELVAGYRIDNLSAVRFSLGHNPGKEKVALRDDDISTSYQLNVTNLFTGTDVKKRLELEAFAGLSYMNVKDLSLAIGGVVGVQANYHLNDRFYVYVSPEARIVHSKYKTVLGVGYKW